MNCETHALSLIPDATFSAHEYKISKLDNLFLQQIKKEKKERARKQEKEGVKEASIEFHKFHIKLMGGAILLPIVLSIE